MVRVSVAPPPFGSLIVTVENGLTGASEVVVWAVVTTPPMVGADAGSVSVTDAALLVAGVANALLLSLSVKGLVELVPGAPAVGVKDKASSSLVTTAAVPLNV